MTSDAIKYYQDREDEFHLWLGRSISQWAAVDESLFQIFHLCVGPYEQCAIIYYRVPGLDARLNLIDEIVKHALPRPHKKSGHHHKLVISWSKSVKNFQSLLSIRRRIAHHPVIGMHSMDFEKPLTKEQEYWLEISANMHERRREKADKSSLKLADLHKHVREVNDLNYRLQQFLGDAHEELRAKPETPNPPPLLDQYLKNHR